MTPLTRQTATILAALLAIVIVAPVSAGIGDPTWRQAADPEHEIAVFANPTTGQAWIAGRLPMASDGDARALVATTDADDIARNLDMTILASDVNTDLAPLGIGPMQMHAGTMGADDAVALLTSCGADVWLFLIVLPDIGALDAEAVVMWTVETMTDGVARAPGAGFVAIDTGSTPALGGGWS